MPAQALENIKTVPNVAGDALWAEVDLLLVQRWQLGHVDRLAQAKV